MEEPPNTTEGRITLIAQGAPNTEGAPNPERISQLLNATFDAEDYLTVLCGYPNPQQYIDGLYQIFCNIPPEAPIRRRCLRALRKAGGETGFLPSSYQISFELEKQDTLANAAGGFSDVWKANCSSGTTYALKVLRVTQQDDISVIKKRFCKEVLVAKQVSNPNLLAIVGVQMTGDTKLCIVSHWMENGNMHAYLKGNKVADCVELLLGVTRGLDYLHFIEVIHGDLKSSNILIDPDGNPRLTDFGFSSITMNSASVNASTPSGRGSTRWRAPELLALSIKPKDKEKNKTFRPTKKSDMYSFAMVIIEIFTGEHPFDSYSDEQVILLLSQGSRPEKPVHRHFTSRMWSLTKKCWGKDPNRRPDMQEVLKKLESGAGHGRNQYRSLAGSLSAFFNSRMSLQFGERSDTLQ